jgi:hypothetical protein
VTAGELAARQADELDALADLISDQLAGGMPPKAVCQLAITATRLAAARLRVATRGSVIVAGFVRDDTQPDTPVPELAARDTRRHLSAGQLLLGILAGALVLIVVFAAGSASGNHARTLRPALIPASKITTPAASRDVRNAHNDPHDPRRVDHRHSRE